MYLCYKKKRKKHVHMSGVKVGSLWQTKKNGNGTCSAGAKKGRSAQRTLARRRTKWGISMVCGVATR